ncbi:MAG: DUF4230 domain-containing protein [Desulfococcaceae bacterium]
MQDTENHSEQNPDVRISLPVPAASAGSGSFTRSFIMGTLLFMLLTLVGTVAFFLGKMSDPIWPVWEKTEPEMREDLVIDRIRQIAKFVSVEYHMADIIEYTQEQYLPFWDKKMLIIAKARVLAGFDFDKGISVTVEERGGQKQAVHITLPRPEIISVEPEYRYYDIRGSIPAEDHTLILSRAKTALRQAAIREGILDKARESVQIRLPYLFPASEVYITFSQETKKHNERDGNNPY